MKKVECMKNYSYENLRDNVNINVEKGEILKYENNLSIYKNGKYVCRLYYTVGKVYFRKINTEENKNNDLKLLSKDLLDWLYKNGTPHTTITITQSGIEVSDSRLFTPFKIRD